MIRTIIFDLSEVLISGLVGIEGPISSRWGIPENDVSPPFYNDRLYELLRDSISEDNYLQSIIEATGWAIPPNELKRLIRENFHHRVPGMEPVLKRLKDGYELILLSDHAREWITYVQRIHPFLKVFDRSFFSFELGMTKDDPAIFRTVLDILHRTASECVFIDDNPMNIETATSLGIPCIRFVSAENLMHRLEELGLWH